VARAKLGHRAGRHEPLGYRRARAVLTIVMMRRSETSKNRASRHARWATAAVLAVAWAGIPPSAWARAPIESLEYPDGRRVQGHFAGSLASGFSFIPADGSPPLTLESGSIVHFDGPGPDAVNSPPLFRVLSGDALRLSGSLRSISPTAVRLGVSWQGPEISLSRPGVQVVLQRPGVARVLVDNFESLDASRWTTSGKVSLVEEPHLSERKSLRLPPGGASIAHNLDEPLAAGRLELAYHDDGLVAAGLRWSIDLTFQGPSGATLLRVVPGWSDESLALEMPSFPALAVQRLARTPGWHRFMVRFSPENTEISVDGKDLAHGKAPEGPLISIRIASSAPPAAAAPAPDPAKTPVCHIDDLQLTRFAEPSTSFELDIKQDEARLVVGDQLFGKFQKADSEHMSMAVEGKAISLPWGQISSLHFRRDSASGAPVEGLLARVEWRSAPGADPTNLDFAEGAITAASDGGITVATPYSGVLSIPRQLMHSLLVRGHGRWYLIDATAHHLGDELSTSPPVLDPPAPEGGVLERTIELQDVPDGSWFLVVDVVQMVGENGEPDYAEKVKNGELRTNALINGRRIDYVNRHIKARNETPERVAMAIPAGLLHPGKNTIRLELTADKETQLDDLGVLQMALMLTTKGNAKATGSPAAPP
jgi:hypothetical protein